MDCPQAVDRPAFSAVAASDQDDDDEDDEMETRLDETDLSTGSKTHGKNEVSAGTLTLNMER